MGSSCGDTLTSFVLRQLERCSGARAFQIRCLERDPLELDYHELVLRARRYARLYRDAGLNSGDVVVIVTHSIPETIFAFVGAMLVAAKPAVFSPPSSKMRPEYFGKTLVQLSRKADARFIATSQELLDLEIRQVGPVAGLTFLTDSQAADCTPLDLAQLPVASPDDVAFLQFSSGTTGLKKGVTVSHRAAINQIRNLAAALRLSEADSIASWLPLYHDMGLIATFVLPLVLGIPSILMSPFEWVARPAMLLEAIDRERSTLCWLPNFAFSFLAQRVGETEVEAMDLSCVRAWINCAEPISASSQRRFVDRFAPCGVGLASMCSSYAMAENTFAVTQGGTDGPLRTLHVDTNALLNGGHAIDCDQNTPRSGRTLVTSGTVIPRNEVQIVSEGGDSLPDRRVGEILVRSDSHAHYYEQPELNAEAFQEGWYWTGDLGFLLEGHLFVTGRKKDLIIVGGSNIYPQDIEELLNDLPGIYPGRVVAFGLKDEQRGTELVVCMAEVTDDVLAEASKRAELKAQAAELIGQQLGCAIRDFVLCHHRTLIKSTSGKISRSANRHQYTQERLRHAVP